MRHFVSGFIKFSLLSALFLLAPSSVDAQTAAQWNYGFVGNNAQATYPGTVAIPQLGSQNCLGTSVAGVIGAGSCGGDINVGITAGTGTYVSGTCSSSSVVNCAINQNNWVTSPQWGAKCDAQVVYAFPTITAGTAGTRDVSSISSGIFSTSDIGKNIDISIGGVSATSGWHGVIASVISATHITVTASAGTAISSTPTTLQYGTDDTAAINAAIQAYANGGMNGIIIPGLCAVYGTINANVSGLHFGGNLGNYGHHDNTPSGPLAQSTSGLVFVGGIGNIVLNVSSVAGASNLRNQGIVVHDLTIFAGNVASVGVQTTSVEQSEETRIYCFSAVGECFDFNVVATLGEIGGNCNNVFNSLSADLTATVSGIGLRLGGNSTWNTCLNTFVNTDVLMSKGGDAIQIVEADHNNFLSTTVIAIPSSTGYSVHFSGIDSTHYAQANGFRGLSVGDVTLATQAIVHSESLAQGNWIQFLDNYNPPAGWHPNTAAGATFNCQNDNWTTC